jgi:hypothetical protein
MVSFLQALASSLVKSCSFASDEYVRGIVGDETEKRRERVLRDETNLDSDYRLPAIFSVNGLPANIQPKRKAPLYLNGETLLPPQTSFYFGLPIDRRKERAIELKVLARNSTVVANGKGRQ